MAGRGRTLSERLLVTPPSVTLIAVVPGASNLITGCTSRVFAPFGYVTEITGASSSDATEGSDDEMLAGAVLR
jgi:hypothetical protein